MWNNQGHFEAYLAVPSMGAVLNTVNIRLFSEQIFYILSVGKFDKKVLRQRLRDGSLDQLRSGETRRRA